MLTFIPGKYAKHIKKRRSSKNAKEILNRLETFLKGNLDEPVNMLAGFWKDQQKAISYPELREIVLRGGVTTQQIDEWMHDYTLLVNESFSKVWESAMEAGSHGQPILDGKNFSFDFANANATKWIYDRGSQFVTNCTDIQKQAISTMLLRGMEQQQTVDEIATNIRACIGLTRGQATAAMNYYDNVKKQLRDQHPNMWNSTIETKAKRQAQMYAERLHRQRAMTIAQTEMAFAYNQGTDLSMRQAYAENLVGAYKKVWTTSGDDRVCSTCEALDGKTVGMEGDFGFGRGLFDGDGELPPAHPRCACAIEYVEVDQPLVTESSNGKAERDERDRTPQFRNMMYEPIGRVHSENEVYVMAKEANDVVGKYIDKPSKWSGKVNYSDEYIGYFKEWNCSVTFSADVSPHTAIHEMLHARSVSYFSEKDYDIWNRIEEATVEYAAKTICKAEGIMTLPTEYDPSVYALSRICKTIDASMSDFEWSKKMLEMKMTKRYNWLRRKIKFNRLAGEEMEECFTMLRPDKVV